MEKHWGKPGPAPPPKVEFKKVYEEIPRRKGDFRGQLVGIVLKV